MFDEEWLISRPDEELEELLNDVRTIQKWHRRNQAWGIAWSYAEMSHQVVTVMVERMRCNRDEWPEQLRLEGDDASTFFIEVTPTTDQDK